MTQPAALEAGDDAGEVAGVEPELTAQVRLVGPLRLCQLEQHSGLGQRVRRVEEAGLEHADLLRPKTVEGADGCDLVPVVPGGRRHFLPPASGFLTQSKVARPRRRLTAVRRGAPPLGW